MPSQARGPQEQGRDYKNNEKSRTEKLDQKFELSHLTYNGFNSRTFQSFDIFLNYK